MSQLPDIRVSELALARILLDNLIRRISGLLSVGTTSLQMDGPATFLNGRDRLIRSFVDVLAATGVRPGSEFAKEFAHTTASLKGNVDRFCSELCGLGDWRQLALAEIDARFDSLQVANADMSEDLDRLKKLLGTVDDSCELGEKGRSIISATQEQLRSLLDACNQRPEMESGVNVTNNIAEIQL